MLKPTVLFWLLLLCFCLNQESSIAQSRRTKIILFSKELNDSLAFTNNWDYPAEVMRDSDGKFHKNEDGKITQKDTSHLYFTANCQTNVQGGYIIRYSFALRKRGVISLSFSDGFPAYASEFNIFISNKKFSFTPKIIYPELILASKTTYQVNKSKLILFNKNYRTSKEISGYIDAEFTETTLLRGKSEKHHYYLKGYFKTPINT